MSWIWIAATLLPLGGFVLQALLGKSLGRAAAYVATGAIASSFVLSAIGFGIYMARNPEALKPPHHKAHVEHHDAEHHDHSHDVHDEKTNPKDEQGAHGEKVSQRDANGQPAVLLASYRDIPRASPKDVGQSEQTVKRRGDGKGKGDEPKGGKADKAKTEAKADAKEKAFVIPRPMAGGAGPAPAGFQPRTGEESQPRSNAIPDRKYEWGQKGATLLRQMYPWATINWARQGMEGTIGTPVGAELGVAVDNITAIMFLMVTLIATCIHVYSIGYMSHEPRFPRFFTYLSLFCFSMLALVIADNLFQVFLCWELVGVCSYLLIGFYYEKRSASNAANKAFVTNRVGDVGFIIGLMILFAHFGVFGFEELFAAIRDSHGELREDAGISRFWLTVAGLGIFVGCVGKSAQFPLHVWLPDAMEGPTPVSALIHAATMVAAGVYLVARAFPLLTPEALIVITYVGGITLFVAATIAVVSTDIKKALAYSTVSQLGYMMMALGLGGWVAGLMHLITHAFFKALLFLCSGSVIHGTGTQEMPEMGGLHKKMPITSWTTLIGVLAICGFPYFSGFYSKDAIIAQVLSFAVEQPQHIPILILPIVTAGITAFYMFRLWFMTFAGKPRDQHIHDHAHESGAVMWVPLVILAVLAVIGAGLPIAGLPTLEGMIAYGKPSAAEAGMLAAVEHRAHSLHGLATLVASVSALLGASLALAVYYYRLLNPGDAVKQFPGIYQLLVNKWYFDEIYRYLLVRPALRIAYALRWVDTRLVDGIADGSARATVQLSSLDRMFDVGVIDGLVNAIAAFVFNRGTSLHPLQSGWLRGYVLYIGMGAVGIFVIGAIYLFA